MAVGDIETFQRDGVWFNRIVGEPAVLGSGYNTQDEAVIAGRGAAVARQVEHIVSDAGPTQDAGPYERHPRDRIGGSAAD